MVLSSWLRCASDLAQERAQLVRPKSEPEGGSGMPPSSFLPGHFLERM